MTGFTAEDRALIESIVADPAASPSFEEMRYCLIWPDEQIMGLSSPGYKMLGKLWTVRGMLHRQVPLEEWGLTPDAGSRMLVTWNDHLLGGLRWVGFTRLALTRDQRDYLLACTKPAAARHGGFGRRRR